LLIVFSKENNMSKKHVAKHNFEEPCAVISARTDLWEPAGAIHGATRSNMKEDKYRQEFVELVKKAKDLQ
jgi:hypothetical protein